MKKNIQTIDGKWQVLKTDTGGYYFYWNLEKCYFSGLPKEIDGNMEAVRAWEIIEI